MNPSGYTNLAKLHFSGSDAFKVKANKELSLKYLAISWEIAEVTNTATKDNTILTMIINGTLGLGDTFYMEENQGGLNMTKAIEDMKPEVLMERDRFKKLYLLSVTDQYPGSLAIDRHY